MRKALAWFFAIFGGVGQPAATEKPKRKRNGAGGRASMQVVKDCPHCGRQTRGPAHARHVAKCPRNPANGGDGKPLAAAAPPLLLDGLVDGSTSPLGKTAVL